MKSQIDSFLCFRWALPEASMSLWGKVLDSTRDVVKDYTPQTIEALKSSLDIMRIYLSNVVC